MPYAESVGSLEYNGRVKRLPNVRHSKQNQVATRVVAYIRVSTDKQADKGVSLDAQRAKVEAYAALHDLTMVDVIVETESAKSLERPGLQRALGMLGASADALLVVKLDRLTRSVRDLGHLVETYFASGAAALLSVAEHVDTRTASGRMVLNIMATISQWERETIGERTSVAMQHMRTRGEHTGGRAPYGHRVSADGVHLEADPAEQATIARASELHAQGLTLRAVAAALAAEGKLSRAATTFAPLAISKMVRVNVDQAA